MTIATILAPQRKNRRATVRAHSAHLLLSLLLLVLCREAAAVPNLRGVASQDERYYQTAIIKCKDGSKSFSQERLNDDFCDCVDGTDEPGTNACPNGKFYCKNLGHKSSLVFSSRVNDGICDCCDGSDEYDGKIKCPNTCRESGKQSSEKLKKKVSTFREGVILRNRDIENSNKQREKDKIELASLKKEQKVVKDIVAKLQVEKEAVEKQEREEKEKERREKEEQEKREKEEKEKKEKDEKEKREKDEQERTEKESPAEKESAVEKESPEQAEGAQSQVEVPPQEEESAPEDADVEGLNHLTEAERGRIIASRWTGEDVSDIISKDSHDDHHIDDEDGDDDVDGNDDGDDDDNDDDLVGMHGNDEDHDYHSSHFTSSDSFNSERTGDEDSSSWWSKLSSVPDYFLHLFGLNRAPVDKSEAERIRNDYREANDNLRNLERLIDDLEKRTKDDFGKDGEFYGFCKTCFELQDKKYTYSMCPYKDANQKETHSSTRLGRWQGFKEDYKEMIFHNGDKCWNGPERSLRVKMRCGTKLELRSIDEPSRCEYVGEFSTPALCTPAKLKVLEQQLLQNDPESLPHHEEL